MKNEKKKIPKIIIVVNVVLPVMSDEVQAVIDMRLRVIGIAIGIVVTVRAAVIETVATMLRLIIVIVDIQKKMIAIVDVTMIIDIIPVNAGDILHQDHHDILIKIATEMIIETAMIDNV